MTDSRSVWRAVCGRVRMSGLRWNTVLFAGSVSLTIFALLFFSDWTRPSLSPEAVLSGKVAPEFTTRLEAAARLEIDTLPGLSVAEGKFLLHGEPYRGVGVNYYALFTRLCADPTDTSTLVGLEQLAEAGVPFVRFNAGGFVAGDWMRYWEDPRGHFEQMDRVVRAAEEAGIGLIPTLFWTLSLNELVREAPEEWGNPDSLTLRVMRDYTREMVLLYRESPAILAWECSNELNLYVNLPNAAEFMLPGKRERYEMRSEELVVLLTEFGDEVRRHDRSRPLISGHSHPRPNAWHNAHENSWEADDREQWREMLLRHNPDPMNTLGVHLYGDEEATLDCGVWAADYPQYMSAVRQVAKARSLPIFVGEFGIASNQEFSPDQVRERFLNVLGVMQESGVSMAAFWAFDRPGQSHDWNVTFENHRSYMLELAVEANEVWQRAASQD